MNLQRGLAAALILGSLGFAVTMNDIGKANQSHTFMADFSRGDTPGVGYTQVIANTVNLLENNDNYVVVLEGHAGTRGPSAANLALSERRTERMSADLQDAGIVPDRIITYSKGEDEPLTQTDGENDGKFQARLGRVEIYVIHNKIDKDTIL
jgi:hypothetical protein